MPNYTKLFSSIVTSTIWSEDDKTRVLWITMLAISDQHGEVHASIPGLARIAGISVEDCEMALAKFLSPDGYSRTKDHEGKRIAEIPGGWELLNHAKYRRLASKIDKDEANAARQARHRERNAAVTHSNAAVTPEPDKQKQSTEAEAPTTLPISPPAPEALFLEAWNALPAPFPKCRAISSGRKAALRSRMKEEFWVGNWKEALSMMPTSKFLSGQNDRHWIADVDFFLRPDSVAKIIEHKYDQQRPTTNQRGDSNRNIGHNAGADYSKRSDASKARADRELLPVVRALLPKLPDEGERKPDAGA